LALLIKIHPHDQRLSECLTHLNKALPRRMMSKDIPHYQFFASLVGGIPYSYRPFYCIGQWLLYKYMTTFFESLNCKTFMGVEIVGNTCRDKLATFKQFHIVVI